MSTTDGAADAARRLQARRTDALPAGASAASASGKTGVRSQLTAAFPAA